MGGVVVYARYGHRSQYCPLQTPLCSSNAPSFVVAAFMSVYPFETVYIADLDALMHKGDNSLVIRQLLVQFPDVEFWVDQGAGSLETNAPNQRQWVPVIGSESINDEILPDLLKFYKENNCILSLDYSQHGFLGAKILCNDETYWPKRLILMNLSSVGSQLGPDWIWLERYVRQWPNHVFIAAGGIRNQEDLERMAILGIDTALVASALHFQKLDGKAIDHLRNPINLVNEGADAKR